MRLLAALIFAVLAATQAYAGDMMLLGVGTSGGGGVPVIAATGYFSSVNGLSSNDCSTFNQGAGNVGPCNPAKIPTFLAATVGSNPSPTLAVDPAAPAYLGSTPLLITPTQAPNTGQIIITSYYGDRGAKFDLDAGIDMYGTGSSWSTTTINSHTVCVWNGYHSMAPMIRTLVPLIPRVAWINSHLANWITVPRIPNGWASLPGTAGGPTVGTQAPIGSNVTFSTSTPNMVVADQTQLGVSGDPVLFATSPASNISGNAAKNYYIASSPAIQYDTPTTGQATFQVTVNGPQSLGGTVITPNTSGTAVLAGYPQSVSTGDRSAHAGLNVIPYDATNGNPVVGSGIAAGDTQSEKILFPYNHVLAPIFSVNSGAGTMTLATTSSFLPPMFPRQAYQLINGGQHLAENDPTTGLEYTREWYFNPVTAEGYYTPDTTIGESCTSINQPGVAIIPGSLTNALRISNAVADNSGTSGQFVGGIIIRNGTVQHTNSSIYTGAHTPDGTWGGGFGSESSVNAGQTRSAIELVGARNVQFGGKCTVQSGAQCTAGNGLDVLHVAGSGIEMGCGSSGNTYQYGQVKDLGASGIVKGMQISQFNGYFCPTDGTGGMQTNKYGPSTGTFNQGGSANLPDLTGYHDCCNTVANNWLDTDGVAGASATGSAMIGDSGSQMDIELHNLWQNAPYFGYSALNAVNANPLVWLSEAGVGGPFPVFGRINGFNLGKNFNYRPVQVSGGTVAAGTSVPGMGGGQDFGDNYRFGSGDGPGDGSMPGFSLIQNAMYDMTIGQAPEVATQSGFTANGHDAVHDYSDNYSCGGFEYGNIFLTRSSAAVGFPSYLNRITQHADVCRGYGANNIFAATWPSGWSPSNGNGSNGFTVRNDTTTGNTEWFPSRTYNCTSLCYVFSNKFYYSWINPSLPTSSIAGTQLTVAGTVAAGTIKIGMFIQGAGVTTVAITSQVSGTSGGGSGAIYALAGSAQTVAAETMNVFGTTGSSTSTMPACTGAPGTACPIDGTVTWLVGGPLPLGEYGQHNYVDTLNITAYAVGSTSGTSTDPVAAPGLAGFVTAYPVSGQFAQYSKNLYSKLGVGMSIEAISPSISFTTFQATAGPNGANQELASLWGSGTSPDAVAIVPNFVNLGTGDTRFNATQVGPGTATACGTGLGVSPECSNGFDAGVIADTTAYAGPVAALSTYRTFVALHQYYMDPAGNDSCNGTSPALGSSGNCAWATPNHTTACGDVITAATGSYTTGQLQAWGSSGTITVSGCPSTTAGIDGRGGIYFSQVQCAVPFGCTASSTGVNEAAAEMETSNLALEGFALTAGGAADEPCSRTVPRGPASLHHNAWINNTCNGATAQGFGGTSVSTLSYDYQAIIGNIAYNATQGTDNCYSGISWFEPINTDTVMGTHLFAEGNFSWGNTHPACGSGANSDGNGIALDDLGGTQSGGSIPAYTGRVVVKNNIAFDNYGSGIAVSGSGTSGAPIQIYQNTSYGNSQGALPTSGIPDLNFQSISGTNTGSGSTEITWPKVSAWYNFVAPTKYSYTPTGGGTAYVSAVQVYNSSQGASVSNNVVWNSGTGSGGPSSTLFNNSPQAPNFAFSTTNGNMTSASPAFASPPAHNAITTPDCTTGSPTLVNQCATVKTIIAGFVSKAFPGIGYQPPHTYCVADQDFPRWLKGVIPTGLVDIPCGM